MAFSLTRLAGALALSLIAVSPAPAEMRGSQSNDPTVILGDNLTRLLTTERVALQRLGDRRLARLAAAPRPFDAPTYSTAWLDARPAAKGGKQWECLTEALYFEARGESVQGQFAVAEVILNRVSSPDYPDTVCGVVNQGTGKRHQCQFSYNCDGKAEVIREKATYVRLGKIARFMLDGAPRRLTGGATHYHTIAVNPRWASRLPRTATIGVHHFYRQASRAR
ncbi:cell wall hydrolase [Rhodovulum adriaticum]|uniref:Cell wall hydrolase n=1 Tax=Rhodovulum adriaticum TaxID=35804 RepID=A0A4R2NJG1_RHOAD|nr:cell wall hydrolase [Rhodovulum adriaticum]MBK1634711.1 cell wall hydrolase [Rhodovulum adriaticum]TCP21580.1 cell wall hydrolase [Rhodovulum adriaticum]